jgi:ribonuclease P protein component
MLSKKLRLARKDFIAVKNLGKRFSGRYLSAIVCRRTEDGNLPDRFAVVVSRKVAKKATARNHLRRWIYAVLADISVDLSRDIIIFCDPSVINLNDEKIRSEINSFISKIPA